MVVWTRVARNFYPLNWFKLGLIDKYTLHWLILTSILDGLAMGVFGLASFVVLKSLSGSSIHVTILQLSGSVALVSGIFFTEWMLGRDKRKFLLWFGVLGRLTLLLMLFVSTPTSFLVVCTLVFIFSSGIIPATNAILQANISRPLLGKLYSVTVSIASSATMIGTFIGGLVLEAHQKNFQWLFALAGVVGFIGIYLRSKVHIRGGAPRKGEKTLFLRGEPLLKVFYRSVVVPLVHSTNVLKQNPTFATFERNFFIYGLAFMIMAVVAPVFLVEELAISYTQVGISGFFFQLATIATLPIFGRFYDKNDPAKFSRWVYLILAFYPLTLFLAKPLAELISIPPIIMVYLSSIIFGAGMAGLSLVWSLGNIFFAGERDAAPFMGAHITLVGIRGAMGPVIGYILNTFFGPYPVCILATLLFLTASFLMHKLSYHLEDYQSAKNIHLSPTKVSDIRI